MFGRTSAATLRQTARYKVPVGRPENAPELESVHGIQRFALPAKYYETPSSLSVTNELAQCRFAGDLCQDRSAGRGARCQTEPSGRNLLDPFSELHHQCTAWTFSGWSSRRAPPIPFGCLWSGTECRLSEYADPAGT